MLTSEQRETLRKLECNNYLFEHQEEAIDAALETIDELTRQQVLDMAEIQARQDEAEQYRDERNAAESRLAGAIAEGEARATDRMRLVTDDVAAIADAIALLRRKDYNDVADELEAATSRVREAPRLTPQHREALASLADAATPGQLEAIEAALAVLV